MAVDLAQAKAHLIIDHDHDDAVLTQLLLTAEGYLCRIGITTEEPRKPEVDSAVLLIVGALFHDREGGTDKPSRESVMGIARLTAPLRTSVG